MFEIFNTIIPVIEILILWIVFYRMLIFFEGTRALQVLQGLFYLSIIFLLTKYLALDRLNFLLTKFFAISIIALVIIFQHELRQGLARLGQGTLFNMSLDDSDLVAIIEELTSAAFKLSQERVGGLIALERETKLKPYIDSGVPIDGKISAELIKSIFMPNSPLHDGGLILRGGRIVASSCLFPLSENPNFSKIIGTRHRAAVGLTEQTDSIVIVISEETGEISVASNGRFIPIVNRDRLVNVLKSLTMIEPKAKK
ncbi:MAG: diadenylate cyclase CdaA [Candidatus Omnitrophica bacterium]|nr:diadenylate cyclase CdaA [Candidatus Omnitrophota bacterium]